MNDDLPIYEPFWFNFQIIFTLSKAGHSPCDR